MTEGGNQVVDTAVLYPVESCWPRYIPSRTWANDSADVLAISGCYATVSESLWRSGRDFTIIDSRAITEASVSDKGLEHPCGVSWRAVILPSVDTLPLETWKQRYPQQRDSYDKMERPFERESLPSGLFGPVTIAFE